MKEVVAFEGVHCANCSAPMQGEFCHHCGQSIHTVLRPMHHMMEDTMDMFLHVDGRVVHTLPPLMTKPGFLTLEYFSGRRQRYVAPFRLMFVICLLAFFTLHIAVNRITDRMETAAEVTTGEFAKDTTPDAVRARMSQLETGLTDASADSDIGSKAARKLIKSQRAQANKRLTELGAPSLEGKKSDEESFYVEPVHISWLPDAINNSLTRTARHAAANMSAAMSDGEAAQQARERMVAGAFSALPQTMFVMIPLFALLLKIVYIFKRRLYMEHLIVALHSHAFLFATLLLVALTGMLSTWLKPHAAWTGWIFGIIQFALCTWAPAYLLIMQKRVYRQGWFMTTMKYLFVGWMYIWLLTFALTAASLMAIAH
ncbi:MULTISPECIES: DUF3667 domain-containing protein [Dyella]|uniref:DUF3667 domain-containing protein n=2 Tax=Dyella TaxID=231454 RepID=A0A4R0YN31_9GAMM|nr:MULTISPECIES: DUF3667 domain-containing protein [Dyella]TBR36306.1 DUF3667 domain-containing protein [Dyella terrae]TCI05963.1 DUF3667 domain-containing protein [Dyella soli]